MEGILAQVNSTVNNITFEVILSKSLIFVVWFMITKLECSSLQIKNTCLKELTWVY
jgi:hypothetical protein